MDMVKLRFTREDARELFDRLPLQINERVFKKDVQPLRVTLTVKGNGEFVFVWVSDSLEFNQPKQVTDITANLYYTVVPPNIYKRKGIGVSVDDLYKRVNAIVDKINQQPSADAGQTKKPKRKKNRQAFDTWDTEQWDRSAYTEPVMEQVEGYMGSKGWVGPKADEFTYSNIASLVRKELTEAVNAGYVPGDLRFTVKVRDAHYTQSVVITVRNVGKESDVYNFINGRMVLKKKYDILSKRLHTILNTFNYDKSNLMVDYRDRGFYGDVKFNVDDDY